MLFPTQLQDILAKIDKVDPVAYSRNRNYTDGAVTGLSPYISRGVISVKQVLENVLSRGYHPAAIEPFIKELAWREYFQRTWQTLEDDIFEDIRIVRNGLWRKGVPLSILKASTGIEAVDDAISNLYNTGYMHNHLRMYTASITSNISRCHWTEGAKWMYYHLLDGDIASNTCSWQWVTGHFSNKQYYCNQENINTYTGSYQRGTFLDVPYSDLPAAEIPQHLSDISIPELQTVLPEKKVPELDPGLPLLVYNSYNLDPLWRSKQKANRLLLLEPSHFRVHPVSENVIRFLISLADNIPGIQIFTGEFYEIPHIHKFPEVYSKEHPAFKHYSGIKEQREWIFPSTGRFHSSFFQFWKHHKKNLEGNYLREPLLKTA